MLGAHSFPGNVRELEAMVFDAVARHESGKLALDAFKDWLGAKPAPDPATAAGSNGHADDCPDIPTLKQAEDALVEKALRLCGGNQSAAARHLGISRQALGKRLAVRKQKS